LTLNPTQYFIARTGLLADRGSGTKDLISKDIVSQAGKGLYSYLCCGRELLKVRGYVKFRRKF
jgi:hypothetical protein